MKIIEGDKITGGFVNRYAQKIIMGIKEPININISTIEFSEINIRDIMGLYMRAVSELMVIEKDVDIIEFRRIVSETITPADLIPLDKNKNTFLHLISYNINPEYVGISDSILKTFAMNHNSSYNVINEKGITPAHILGVMGFVNVMQHPDVSTCIDLKGRTPLHLLAMTGKVEILNHPDVSKIYDSENSYTPLHVLAINGHNEIMTHPDAGIVIDNEGLTPLDLLNRYNEKIESMKKS